VCEDFAWMDGEVMKKSLKLDITQLVEAGVTPQMPLRKQKQSDSRDLLFALNNFDWTVLFQVDVVNGLQLLTAKPVIYLVNLSEKDYIRKKNKWYVDYIHVSLPQ
jgi:ribosome-binding ATPase YchF (GTP1/OBG family)